MTSLLPDDDEYLTTGWEPDLPASDSLVRQAVLAHASWAVEAALRAGRPWHRGPGWAGGHVGDATALVNWVVLLRPPHDVGAVLVEVEALLPAPVPYLLISPWPTPDLSPHGLTRLGHPPLMVRLPSAEERQPPSAVEIREVRSARELAVAERIIVEGYPLPELQPVQVGALFDPRLLDGPNQVWLAWAGSDPVAASLAHHTAGATLVELVAVLPEARGRGAGAAVTWAAAFSRPGVPAVLIASDEGQPVYERLGFLRIERWTAWARPGDDACPAETRPTALPARPSGGVEWRS